MGKTRGFIWHVAPALLYTVAIFVGGSIPQGPDLGLDFAFKDKLMHLVAFGVLQWLVWRALGYLRPAWSTGWRLGMACAVAVVLGGALELWQALLPTRQAEGLDWIADFLGALLAALLVWRATRGSTEAPPLDLSSSRSVPPSSGTR